MPLLDHFQPPLSIQRPWDGVPSAWAGTIAAQLNRDVLPADYFALPQVTVEGRLEIDVATMHQGQGTPLASSVWSPPAPSLAAALDAASGAAFEVQVMRQVGTPQLRAAIELVSPGNKDRPAHRLAFALKCAAYLMRGVSVVIIDVATERSANLHADISAAIHLDLGWQPDSGLYAVAYRLAREPDNTRVEAWTHELAVNRPLPTLPVWLEAALCVPLHLEESYAATCAAFRIPA